MRYFIGGLLACVVSFVTGYLSCAIRIEYDALHHPAYFMARDMDNCAMQMELYPDDYSRERIAKELRTYAQWLRDITYTQWLRDTAN